MFYTILPKWPFIKPRFKRIARFAPLIGLFIGLIQSLTWFLLRFLGWPYISASLVSLIITICITGGLHVDGLMDTADGVGAGESQRYKAMKDSRVGAMGVQTFLIVLIIQLAAIIKLGLYAPFAFPVIAFWGRFAQIIAIGNYKYIGVKGSDSFHQKYWTGTLNEIKPSLIILGALIILFVTLTDLNISNILLLIYCLFSGLLTSISIPYIINKLIEGHSGDTYGATILTAETTNLLLISFIFGPK